MESALFFFSDPPLWNDQAIIIYLTQHQASAKIIIPLIYQVTCCNNDKVTHMIIVSPRTISRIPFAAPALVAQPFYPQKEMW